MIINNISYRIKDYKVPFFKVLHFLYKPYKWMVFFPFFVLLTGICGIIIPFLAYFSPKYLDSLAILWSRFSLYVALVWMKIEGRENIDKNQSYVVVANHASQFDIFVIYGWLGIPFKWVMKEELRSVPVIGRFCNLAGHIFIDRKNSKEAIAKINKAKKYLIAKKSSIFFFPEGTRSLDGNVQGFKKGAFTLAKDMNLPVLPVTIKGTHSILPAKTTDLFPGKVELIIHQPFSSEDYDMETLISMCKNKIESSLY